MNAPKVRRISGLVIHVLIAALLTFAGVTKLAGLVPKEAMEEMQKLEIADNLKLIGAGELIAGILLVIPVTSSLGLLLVTGFWGGVICFHMNHHDSYIPYIVFLLLTWLGAFLREPATFVSFYRSGKPAAGTSDFGP